MKTTGRVAISLVLLSYMAIGLADQETFQWMPYVGADLQARNQGFVKNYGDTDFQKGSRPALQVNPFVGIRFNDYVGLELGYEYGMQQKQTYSVQANSSYMLGIVSPYSGTNETSLSLHGGYAGVVGFFTFAGTETALIGSLGIANPQVKLTFQPISKLGQLPYTGNDKSGGLREFTAKKFVARLGIGLQHKLDDNIGFRLTAQWKNMAKFKLLAPNNNATSPLRASLSNSLQYGIGFFWE